MAVKTQDAAWEKRLNIATAAADYEKDDANHSRYEPTGYAVLERLARSGHIGSDDLLIDYGCGKGRVGFYLHYALGCRTIGVEYNPLLYDAAMRNLDSYSGRDGVGFVCANAENHAVGEANRFYFFNPFSEKILRSVLGRIFESYYENPRPMKLFFYYATDEYLSCLMSEPGLEFAGEIDCRDLFFNDDPKEKILIFEIG